MVLTGRRAGTFRRGDLSELAKRYAAECLAVARAEGARAGRRCRRRHGKLFCRGAHRHGHPMLADREAGRPQEWDIRNGVIIRKARAHDIATPISDVLVPLLAATTPRTGLTGRYQKELGRRPATRRDASPCGAEQIVDGTGDRIQRGGNGDVPQRVCKMSVITSAPPLRRGGCRCRGSRVPLSPKVTASSTEPIGASWISSAR